MAPRSNNDCNYVRFILTCLESKANSMCVVYSDMKSVLSYQHTTLFLPLNAAVDAEFFPKSKKISIEFRRKNIPVLITVYLCV